MTNHRPYRGRNPLFIKGLSLRYYQWRLAKYTIGVAILYSSRVYLSDPEYHFFNCSEGIRRNPLFIKGLSLSSHGKPVGWHL